MKFSIIIPAFNEESYLLSTLASIQTAVTRLRSRVDVNVDIIVVDNNSGDRTATVALERGARVVREPRRSIGRARNTGARSTSGDILIFIDADVIVPPNLLEVIHAAMNDPNCVGGAVDVDYRPKRSSMRLYLSAWRILARLAGMAQGATQFCRRCVFEQMDGYDEKTWIGEDVDFYWGMKRYAKANKSRVKSIRSPRVRAYSRRFDKWPRWKVVIWTNPLFIVLFRRWKWVWSGWYSRPVR